MLPQMLHLYILTSEQVLVIVSMVEIEWVHKAESRGPNQYFTIAPNYSEFLPESRLCDAQI